MAEHVASRSLAIAVRGLWMLLTALVVAVALAVAGLTLLDRPAGHSFLVSHLHRLTFKNGIVIGAGSIEGSLFGSVRVHDLTLADPHGVFAEIPLADLDWRPRDLITNRLTVRTALVPELRLLRLPKLLPTHDERILPDIDIFIGKLRIDRLLLSPTITGKPQAHSSITPQARSSITPQALAIAGNVDIRSGRALVDLDAHALGGGDTVRLKLDAEPDRDRFDIDAVVDAPVGGIIDGFARLNIPLNARITGDGKWSAWSGTIVATSGARQLAAATLSAEDGHFALNGSAAPAPLLGGVAARLSTPEIAVRADVRLADRVATTQLHLASRALRIEGSGQLDFARERLQDVVVDARLLDPRTVSPQLGGRDIRLAARVAGTFARPLVDYALTAPQINFGTTVLTTLRATGVAQPGATPMQVPFTATVARVTGINAAADPLLTNVRAEGGLQIGDGVLLADPLTLRSDRATARGNLRMTMATGAFTGTVNATLARYVIAGTGVADVSADLRLAGGAAGLRTTGTARAAFTRIDNASLHNLLGGVPVIVAGIDIAPDLTTTIRDARVTASGLTLTGNGLLSAGGKLQFSASGVSRDYGPVAFMLSGAVDAPQIEVRLASPAFGIGLADLIARIAPVTGGWSFDAKAHSQYGPIELQGIFRTGQGAPAIVLDHLAVAGLTARGNLVQTVAGPFAGQIVLTGPGINGTAQLSATGTTQRADIALTAKDAKLALAVPVTIAAGSADAVLLLPAGTSSPTINGKFALTNLRRGELVVSAADGRITYANGVGTAEIKTKGTAGSTFALGANARLSGDHISVSAAGNLGGRALGLDHPAELTRVGATWQLAPTALVTPEGRAEFSGSFGNDLALHARIDHLGLGLTSLISPNLDLSGNVTGTIDFSFKHDDALPTGQLNLRVNGLSRAGAGKSAARIDLGIVAALTGGKASARMVIAREGKIEGRAQAQLAVIPGGRADPVLTRLFAAPLFAQLRWSGPAQAIWQLAGVEALDVRGPMAIAVDMGGVLGDPSFTGTLTANGARIESTAIGLVFDRVTLDSRFTGSKLDISSFTASAGKDGTIAGSGRIDLSAVRNFPTDIKLDLKHAQLINRDDLRGSATGAVHIVNGADGAKISGKLDIDRARINLGVNSAADVPVLRVSEINGDVINRPTARVVKPTIWQLDLAVAANNRIEVRGMGLDSEWSTNLKVTGRADAPSLVGTVTLVRGDYDFAGKRFRMTRGDVRFAGGFPPDPLINIVAENTSSNLTATLTISGTAQKPEIAFSSIPALPEDEVLSRVLFGESITNLSAPEALQLAGALATLRGGSGGINPINAVRKGLGIDRLRILPADTVTGRKTSIAAGQYIGDRVYVEVTSDAQGYNATSVEVSLTRSLSILSQIATLGGTSFAVRWKRDSISGPNEGPPAGRDLSLHPIPGAAHQ